MSCWKPGVIDWSLEFQRVDDQLGSVFNNRLPGRFALLPGRSLRKDRVIIGNDHAQARELLDGRSRVKREFFQTTCELEYLRGTGFCGDVPFTDDLTWFDLDTRLVPNFDAHSWRRVLRFAPDGTRLDLHPKRSGEWKLIKTKQDHCIFLVGALFLFWIFKAVSDNRSAQCFVKWSSNEVVETNSFCCLSGALMNRLDGLTLNDGGGKSLFGCLVVFLQLQFRHTHEDAIVLIAIHSLRIWRQIFAVIHFYPKKITHGVVVFISRESSERDVATGGTS